MLSNPQTNLHNRQRLHRRQNSTPNEFDSVKVHDLPTIQRHNGHRRGQMSLDFRRQPQDLNSLSTTNHGLQLTQQHKLQETQQQRLARPGQIFTIFDNDENYLGSPIVTPNRQSFDASCPAQYNLAIQVDPNIFTGTNDFNLFAQDSTVTPSAYLDFSTTYENGMEFQSNGNSRRSSAGRRISGGIVDRVAQFEHLALKSPRPITPINQNSTEYYPPTPMDTPCGREIKHESMNPRFADNYDTSMEETIKPRSSQRAKGIFAEMRRAAERAIPSPPQNTQMPSNNAFDSAPIPTSNLMSMSNLNMDFMKQEQSSGPQYSPESSNLSCHSSPEFANMELFGNSFTNKPNPEHCMSYPDPPGHGSHVISSPASHRRSESVSSMNIEETVTDTGITIDDIATYISGPDPNDGKWDCMYPDCKKRFGRKENIKSHVQTHLGDRQYQCSHCKKCFVRQHDLKRHAKIHSGVKPYPCQCGNSFARHDALTRHRQRGMCVGAFEGIVKKLVKRGRPRKNRPNDEERLTKSSKTRNKHKALSSTSLSGGSDSTSGQSPRSELDDILDDKPFGDYEYTQASTIVDRYHYSQAQSPVHIDSQCVSPQMTQTQSPSAFSNHSVYNSYCASVTSDHLPSHPASPTKSFHSYHSPPGLCDSSSSPAPSIHYYDLEVSSPHNLANISEHDDEMFLEAFSTAPGNDSMTTLERDPGLLLRKLEDEFINGSDYESGGFFSN